MSTSEQFRLYSGENLNENYIDYYLSKFASKLFSSSNEKANQVCYSELVSSSDNTFEILRMDDRIRFKPFDKDSRVLLLPIRCSQVSRLLLEENDPDLLTTIAGKSYGLTFYQNTSDFEEETKLYCICKVWLGNIYVTTSPQFEDLSEEYQSVCVEKSPSCSIYTIFDSNQWYPLFLIETKA